MKKWGTREGLGERRLAVLFSGGARDTDDPVLTYLRLETEAEAGEFIKDEARIGRHQPTGLQDLKIETCETVGVNISEKARLLHEQP